MQSERGRIPCTCVRTRIASELLAAPLPAPQPLSGAPVLSQLLAAGADPSHTVGGRSLLMEALTIDSAFALGALCEALERRVRETGCVADSTPLSTRECQE
jgi:hypothetical protein